MSTDNGGKVVANGALAKAKEGFDGARREQSQMQFLDPLTAEEIAAAQDELGPNAGLVSVMRKAREGKGGRKPGSRNRRTEDFARYLRQFGRDPAITLMQIQSSSPEELVARSKLLDPVKRQMSYGDAESLVIRCAEALMPYMHSKKPVAVDVSIDGDFNLLIPGLNINEADAQSAANGTFVLDAQYDEVAEEAGEAP